MNEENKELKCAIHELALCSCFREEIDCLKATVKIYRELAIRFRQDNLVKFEDDSFIVPGWVYLRGEVDALAEGLMKSRQGD